MVNGIIKKIEDLNDEVNENMTKSVQYSEFLDDLALRPVGKNKLNYIKELIDIENFKPLTERNDKKNKNALRNAKAGRDLCQGCCR